MSASWLLQESALAVARDSYLVDNLRSDHRARHPAGKDAGRGEVAAWKRSVTDLAQRLVNCGLGSVYMFIEYTIEPGSPPIDAVLAGVHPETGEPSFLVVELKQWSRFETVDGNPAKVRIPGYKKAKAHPAVQVDNNRVNLLRRLVVFGDRSVRLEALAYLHSANGHAHQWIAAYSPNARTTVITGRSPSRLRDYLRRHLTEADGADAAARLAKSMVLPVSPLQSSFGDVLLGRAQFNLVDEQQETFQEIVAAIAKPTGADKDVFLIEGRPGTGKSVVAVSLLKWARDEGYSCLYVSGGTAVRETFKKSARGFGNLFVPLTKLADGYGPDEVDIVICDEAHRLPHYPLLNNAGTPRPGETSVEIVLSRARVPVFLVDDDQQVRPSEVWSRARIEEQARGIRNVYVAEHELTRPFRAAGSPTYDTWIGRLLGGKGKGPLAWDDDDPFELTVADSPKAMEDLLREKLADGMSARITAGYCWRWSPVGDDGSLVPDVRVGDWHRPWNAKISSRRGNVPPSLQWATADGGFEQIGCVYTAGGLEYDWGGVVFGEDLVWRGDHWVADMKASWDSKVKQRTTAAGFKRSVRNAYGVLLSRSMCGTVIYSVDPETQELFRSLISGNKSVSPLFVHDQL